MAGSHRLDMRVGLGLVGLIGIGFGWWILRRRGIRRGARYDPATERS
jgi:hypothetical protein